MEICHTRYGNHQGGGGGGVGGGYLPTNLSIRGGRRIRPSTITCLFLLFPQEEGLLGDQTIGRPAGLFILILQRNHGEARTAAP